MTSQTCFCKNFVMCLWAFISQMWVKQVWEFWMENSAFHQVQGVHEVSRWREQLLTDSWRDNEKWIIFSQHSCASCGLSTGSISLSWDSFANRSLQWRQTRLLHRKQQIVSLNLQISLNEINWHHIPNNSAPAPLSVFSSKRAFTSTVVVMWWRKAAETHRSLKRSR